MTDSLQLTATHELHQIEPKRPGFSHCQVRGDASMTMRNARARFLRCTFVALAVIASARCSNPLNGEGGLPAPKDPGTLVVRVRDQSGAPVRNAHVSVEMPNTVGSFFTEGASTQANGNMTFYYVPAGRRRVEVTLPSGYTAGAQGVVQEVDVVKGHTTEADFLLVRM